MIFFVFYCLYLIGVKLSRQRLVSAVEQQRKAVFSLSEIHSRTLQPLEHAVNLLFELNPQGLKLGHVIFPNINLWLCRLVQLVESREEVTF